MRQRFLPRNWNDVLSIVVLLLITGLWVANRWLVLPGEVTGASIAAFMAVVTFYFRKAPPPNPGVNNPPK